MICIIGEKLNSSIPKTFDSYYTTQLGLKDCTLVSVMEKADFPKWLQNQKNHHESMSENLLTSQAEIRHR